MNLIFEKKNESVISDAKIIDDISKDTTFELSAAIYKWLDYRAKYYSYPLYVNEGKRLYFQIKQVSANNLWL